MNRTDLSRQHPLVESPVARAQHRSAISAQLSRHAQPWRHNVPCVQRARTTDDVACLPPFRIDCVEVLTDGAAVVESHAEIDCEPISNREGVARECRSCDELPTSLRGRAGDRLKRLPVAIDEPDATRNDLRLIVLAPFERRPDFPLVVDAKQRALVMAECRLGGRANERRGAKLRHIAARDAGHAIESVGRHPIPGTGVVCPRIDEAPDSYIPECVGGQCLRQMPEGYGRHRRVRPQGGDERRHSRRALWVDPEFVAEALK